MLVYVCIYQLLQDGRPDSVRTLTLSVPSYLCKVIAIIYPILKNLIKK